MPLKVQGKVIEALPDSTFRVLLEENNSEILAYVAGRLRMNKIKILPGDTVVVEINSLSDKRGRIVYRGRMK